MFPVFRSFAATKQFIPARGRKHLLLSLHLQPPHETIHPRKGTETSAAKRPCNPSGNNSSPQGDGNMLCAQCVAQVGETIHPRKGTETRYLSAYCVNILKQFIPARGRKQSFMVTSKNGTRNNSSPQGDGNPHACKCVALRPRNNSSPQGDGNDARNHDSIFNRETIHPRKGTET